MFHFQVSFIMRLFFTPDDLNSDVSFWILRSVLFETGSLFNINEWYSGYLLFIALSLSTKSWLFALFFFFSNGSKLLKSLNILLLMSHGSFAGIYKSTWWDIRKSSKILARLEEGSPEKLKFWISWLHFSIVWDKVSLLSSVLILLILSEFCNVICHHPWLPVSF